MFRHRELIKAARDHRLCDFIGSNYYCFTTEELKDVIVELICAAYAETRSEAVGDQILDAATAELEEVWADALYDE